MLSWTYWWLLPAVTAVTIVVSASASDVQSSNGPIIIPAQSEITLQTGQNFTLICKGNNDLSFKHQETYEDRTGSFVMKQTNLTLPANDTLDKKYKYSIALDLINVDRFAVGYYACFDNTINSTDFLTNIVEEPKNTEHVSYIYIYVNGSNLNAPMRTFVLAHSGSSKFLIECKPTAPDVTVKLTVDFADIDSDQYSFSPKLGFSLDSNILSDTPTSIFICAFMRDDVVDYRDVIVHKHITHPAPKPRVTSRSRYFLKGETFSVNCTVHYESTNAVELSWIRKPNSSSEVSNDSNENSVTDDNSVLYNNLTIIDASEDDAGEYTCMSKNMNNNETFTYKKVFQAEPQIIIKYLNKPQKIIKDETQSHSYAKKITVFSYPPITDIVLLKDNVPVSSRNEKYHLKETQASHSRTHDDETYDYMMSLRNLDTTDAGNYSVLFRNGLSTERITFDLKIIGPPKVYFGSLESKRYLINQQVLVECEVTGYPLPNVEWIFSVDDQEEQLMDQEDTVEATYKKRSVVKLQLHQSGNLTCKATNVIKSGQKYVDQATREVLIYEMPDGFGIKGGNAIWLSEEQDATVTCLASKYDFSKPTWIGPTGNITDRVKYSDNLLSYVAELRLEGVTAYDTGEYTCVGWNYVNSKEVSETVAITVEEIRPPEIRDPDKQIVEVVPFQPINFTCSSDAVPPPEIEWYKDGELVENTSNVNVYTTYLNHTTAFSMLKIFVMNETNTGEYECRSTSHGYVNSKFYSLVLKEASTNKVIYLSVIGVIFALLVVLVIYLSWKIRKEKQFRKELAAAGLLYFKEGVAKSINPELEITEQAELLPYDEKFEFPAEKLILGKQLGAGAFGVVYKAEARGIINAEETTTVAVKMVKKTADNMYIKALASELKIMVHLGKHINIVNLLGACTKNVGKRELSVIVEYCRFGNIHRYLQQHRGVFVDTLNDNTEKVLGKVNKGYWSSSNNSGANSEYFGSSNHTQNTDQTFVNTANTNRSSRKAERRPLLDKGLPQGFPQRSVLRLPHPSASRDPQQVVGPPSGRPAYTTSSTSETGYMQPEWRSNYESDYSFEGRSPRPLFSRDLLCWAFQIARGMEYLASRKVLHGDLAARNILLADDNVVKICDFGLAKSIYKNDEYQKKENSPLPVKWLAIECISDGIFSTQSDVWSFGIVLWELFTLAKTPYPNLSNDKVYPWLCDGNRLQKPDYADDKLYDVMRRCWEQKPTARPSFSQLQEIIGSFLEENVRNHYVDLNDPYMSMNLNKQNESEDYLDMVASPDYRNLVTPSAHHYVNDTQTFVLPTNSQLEHDAEGYLQMSPARRPQHSPRTQNSKFDFDERKLTSRVSDGSELTPMLTLNHLPRSGSESDHEDGQNAPSYLNVCPRIEEEADNDNVFELKQTNTLDSKARAVANPSYILQLTDKKPKRLY